MSCVAKNQGESWRALPSCHRHVQSWQLRWCYKSWHGMMAHMTGWLTDARVVSTTARQTPVLAGYLHCEVCSATPRTLHNHWLSICPYRLTRIVDRRQGTAGVFRFSTALSKQNIRT